MKKLILPVLLLAASSAEATRFNLSPKEGYVVTIACQSDYDDECSYNSYLLTDSPMTPLSSKRKGVPGLSKAPEAVRDAIEAAANAMGDVSYIHVAITYKSSTFEYSFDRTTGWNSFRVIPSASVCKLECKNNLITKPNQ